MYKKYRQYMLLCRYKIYTVICQHNNIYIDLATTFMSDLCFCINAYITCTCIYASFGRHPLTNKKKKKTMPNNIDLFQA